MAMIATSPDLSPIWRLASCIPQPMGCTQRGGKGRAWSCFQALLHPHPQGPLNLMGSWAFNLNPKSFVQKYASMCSFSIFFRLTGLWSVRYFCSGIFAEETAQPVGLQAGWANTFIQGQCSYSNSTLPHSIYVNFREGSFMPDVVLASSCQYKAHSQTILLEYFVAMCVGESFQLLLGDESFWRHMGTF